MNSKRKTVSGISEQHTKRDNSTFIAESDEDTAEVLSGFLAVSSKEPSDDLSDENFDKETVRKLLTSVSTSKSQGPDGLHPKLMYELADVICKPLTLIFNKSFEIWVVPDEWKSQITTLCKKGDKNRRQIRDELVSLVL